MTSPTKLGHKMKFKVNDFVKFNHPNGSYGIITEIYNDVIYVKYHYGLDNRGYPITSLGAINHPQDLVEISEEQFKSRANFPCNWGS